MYRVVRAATVSTIALSVVALVPAPASAQNLRIGINAANGAYGVGQWFDGSETLCVFAGSGPINGDWARVTIVPKDGSGPRFSVKALRGHGRLCRKGLAVPENERYRMKLVAFDTNGDDWWVRVRGFTT